MASSKNQDREAREARERLKRFSARQSVHETQVSRRRRDNLFAVAAGVIVIALAATAQVFYFTTGPGMPVPVPTETPTAEGTNVGDIPSPDLAEAREWTGALTLNDVELGISLDGAAAPQAVSAFISQVQSGYFVGTTCHRLVVAGTAGLIQCGSLDGVGGADPEYSFGPIENAPADDIYPVGTIAMARVSGDAYTQGHQFFIVFGEITLPADAAGGYTVLGTVTSGLDLLQSEIVSGGIIAGASGEGDGAPVIPTTITSATIQ